MAYSKPDKKASGNKPATKKSDSAKAIETRVHYEASEEGFSRGGKKKNKPLKPGGGY